MDLTAGGETVADGCLYSGEQSFNGGDTVGRYVLLELLGEGGMGQVFAAYDTVLDRRVALKALRRSERRGRLVREAQALAKLTSPNVVSIYDVVEARGDVLIAMELVEGCNLRQWLRRRAHSAAEIVRVFVEAGRGLQAAHAAGLVHRDFKPDNVLVGHDGRVCVTDFGLARNTEDADTSGGAASSSGLGRLTQTGMVMGTPAYMPVEQHLGMPTDPRSDQFSFCVALFEALFGVRPFAGASGRELCAAIRRGPLHPTPTSRVSSAVQRALRRGLAAEPAARFPSMAALLDALCRPPKRNPGSVLAGVFGLLAIAGAGLGAAHTLRERPKAARVVSSTLRVELEAAGARVRPTVAADCDAFGSALGARMMCLEQVQRRSLRRARP